jgi:hypothetical protein
MLFEAMMRVDYLGTLIEQGWISDVMAQIEEVITLYEKDQNQHQIAGPARWSLKKRPFFIAFVRSIG